MKGLDLEGQVLRAEVARRLFRKPGRVAQLGRFEIKRKLGHGGMGVVYEAFDTERRERVAIKCLRRLEPRHAYWLKQEFRALSQLHDEHLVQLYELFALDDNWFFSMELLAGERFDQYVRPGGTLRLSRLRRALPQLAQAVSWLHAAGKLHCDLKPENVLVGPDGHLKLVDFGLSVGSADVERREGPVMGTPEYMAPEQIQGLPPGEASDWYAVGVMLFEALTGVRPGQSANVLPAQVRHDMEPRADAATAELMRLCAELLRHEAMRRPTGTAVMARVRAWCAQPAALPAPPRRSSGHPFVGRERELLALHEALEATLAGTTQVVLLEGCSGMGKSALLARFCARLDGRVMLLSGRCYENESVPYKALDAVMDALSRELGAMPREEANAALPAHIAALSRLFPALERLSAVRPAPRSRSAALEQRRQAFDALKQLLRRLSQRRPIVVLVDDLQWADVDSAKLLSVLLAEPDPPAMLLVAAYRSDEREHSAFLQQALGHGGALARVPQRRRVHLGPLEQRDAETLVMELASGGLSAHAAAAVVREAQGLPFFIRELVEHFETFGATRGEVPCLSAVLQQRVAHLPAEARALLRVLSVAGAPLEQSVACRAAGLDPSERGPLRCLRAAHLARSRGPGKDDLAEIYHDRIRETVVAALSAQAARSAHAALAEALAAADAEPERLIEHYAAIGAYERAGIAARRAALSATEKLAFERAAELYVRAMELLPDSTDPGLHEALGDALANAGRASQAADAYLQAADCAAAADAQRLQQLAVRQFLRGGRTKEGIDLARRVLHRVGVPCYQSSTAQRAALLGNRAMLTLRGVAFEAGGRRDVEPGLLAKLDACGSISREVAYTKPLLGALLGTISLRLALDAGDPEAILRGMAARVEGTAIISGTKGARQLRRWLARIRRLADEIGTPSAEATVLFTEAISAFYMAHFDKVLEPALEADRLFAEECSTGTAWERGLLASVRCVAYQFRGDLDLISREPFVYLAQARERDDRFVAGNLMFTACTHHLAADDPDSAFELIAHTRAQAADEDFGLTHVGILLRSVDTHLYGGDAQGAWNATEELWPAFERSLVARSQFMRTIARFARARSAVAASGSSPRAGKNAHRLARQLEREDTPLSRAYALSIRAGLAVRGGERHRALDLLEASVRAYDAQEMFLYSACARHRQGELLGGSDGRALMGRAHAFLNDKGARRPERWPEIYSPV